MTVQDNFLKARTERAIALQTQGLFVTDHHKQLPLPAVEMHFSRSRDGNGRYFDYETDWGKFSFDPEVRSLLVLRQGKPPAELTPQPRLSLATATVHTGYVAIHNNGSSIEMDLETRDRLDYPTLRLINQTLVEESLPIVVWKAEQAEEERPPIIRIANDSAMLFASSAIWDLEEQQLVAAQVATTSQDLLKAIKATLANNSSKSYLSVKTPDESAYLKGARRGFITVSNNLTQANAQGTVTTLLHPLSGDPQTSTEEHFYVVVTPGECIAQKFAERLDLAIPWPIQSDSDWANHLLEAGQDGGLVQVLPSSGKDFSAGLRVAKNESLWRQVIAAGIQEGHIAIQ